jgi:hypothetical protein
MDGCAGVKGDPVGRLADIRTLRSLSLAKCANLTDGDVRMLHQ